MILGLGLGAPFSSTAILDAIRALFSSNEQGVVYDPSDMSTLFQDSAGTVPVTAVEQPVGRILDKSGRGNHAIQPTTTKRPVLKQDAGGQYYLKFDGVDDAMFTNPIDFTATDKMTVFVGVRKLSDVVSIVAELSSSATVNTGSFSFVAGEDLSSRYSSLARGTAVARDTQAAKWTPSNLAPDTAVLAVTHDIAGDLSNFRRNGVNGTSGTGDKGTGNFGNYPLFIGSRAGIGLFFNGHLYGLIVRGAQSTLPQIEATELYMKKKVGIA